MVKLINTMWLTGFCEAEACFHVSFTKREHRKVKVEVRPSFSVTQHARSKPVLVAIMAHFQCGAIRHSRTDNCFRYEVRAIRDLHEKIIPHFETWRFMGPKHEDFELFKAICARVRANKHKSPDELKNIIELAFLINSPGKRKYSKLELLKLVAR